MSVIFGRRIVEIEADDDGGIHARVGLTHLRDEAKELAELGFVCIGGNGRVFVRDDIVAIVVRDDDAE